MSKSYISYKENAGEKLDELLLKYGLEVGVRQSTTVMSKRVVPTENPRVLITTAWSNVNFIQLCIEQYMVLQGSKSILRHKCDIFEFISYCWEVLQMRLANQKYVHDWLQASNKLLESAVLPYAIVQFMEELAPRYTPDGTLLVFAPYEYGQAAVQADAAHHVEAEDAVAQHSFVTRTTHGSFTLVAGRTYRWDNGEAVENGALDVIRINVYELVRRADIAVGNRVTHAAIQDLLQNCLTVATYVKRPDHINSFVYNMAALGSSRAYPILNAMAGILYTILDGAGYTAFTAFEWYARTMTVTPIQVYHEGHVRMSRVNRTAELMMNPFIVSVDTNVSRALNVLGMPQFQRLSVNSLIDSIEVQSFYKQGLTSKSSAEYLSDLYMRTNGDF